MPRPAANSLTVEGPTELLMDQQTKNNIRNKLLAFWHGTAEFSWIPAIVSLLGLFYIGLDARSTQVVHSAIPATLKNIAPEFLRTSPKLSVGVASSVLFILVNVNIHIAMRYYRNRRSECQASSVELQAKVEELDQLASSRVVDTYKFFSLILKSIADSLELKSTDRVSLYMLESAGFQCIGRYSENQEYKKKPNRLYANDQGCIGEAWRSGNSSDKSLPCPRTECAAYAQHQEQRWRIPASEVAKMRMASRCYVARAVKDIYEGTNVAVLLFESTQPEGLSERRIDTAFNRGEARKLFFYLIKELKTHIPSMDGATELGL